MANVNLTMSILIVNVNELVTFYQKAEIARLDEKYDFPMCYLQRHTLYSKTQIDWKGRKIYTL